jgi:serine/threonine-protein kinase
MAATASIMLPAVTSQEIEACVPGALVGGKYRLEHLLGEGGMANVWLARNELLDLPVAVKVMRRDIRGDEAAARLLTEARVQANLRHPNVVRVYDYGLTASGDAYIVMEHLEGCSLADWIEREGALSPELAVKFLLPVIDALCAAHRAGVVHRDVKPDNIFIACPEGELCPKLLDFGVAKLDDEFHPRLTGRGGVIGSPAYMAPEQARGLPDVDERADVWATCVVLYEAITGKPTFDGDNYNALMLAVIEYEPPPLTGSVCARLWPIIRAGLAKERDERTGSMLELGAQLAGWLKERGASEELGGEPVGWRWAFAASGVGASKLRAKPGARRRVPTPAALGSRAAAGFAACLRAMHDDLFAPALRSLATATRSARSIRKAAAVKLAAATCVGGSIMMLGLTYEPFASAATSPKAAYAMEETAQPAQPERQPRADQAARPQRAAQPIAASAASLPRGRARSASRDVNAVASAERELRQVRSADVDRVGSSQPARTREAFTPNGASAHAAPPEPDHSSQASEPQSATPAGEIAPSDVVTVRPARDTPAYAHPESRARGIPRLDASDFANVPAPQPSAASPVRSRLEPSSRSSDSEPTRLTSTFARGRNAQLAAPVKPASARSSEAELGLKNPW